MLDDARTGAAPLPIPATDLETLDTLTARLAETAAAADREARLHWPSMVAVHEAGILTSTVGEAFGGPAIGARAFVDAYAAIGEGDPGVSLVALMTSMQHLAISNGVHWPSDLYGRILRDAAERPVLMNLARAEPELGAGSWGGRPATKARRGGTGWIVDGRKSFVTGSEHLDYHAVFVDVPDLGECARAIVPGDAPGVEVVRSWDGIGMRASSTHDVVYREVEIPEEHLVIARPGPGSPIVGAMFGLGVSAIYLGVARAARDALARFLNERVPTSLGAPLATVERLQAATGEVTAQVLTAEEVLHSLAVRLEAGEDPDAPRFGTTKLLCARAAIAAVEEAVRAAGSYGIGTAGPLERHLRDVLCARPHPPQEDVAVKRLGVASLEREHWRSRAQTPDTPLTR